MSRFIRSALFPILIVIIVAMFIEWVISGNRANTTPKAIYAAPFVTTQTVLQSDLQNGVVKTVIFDCGRPDDGQGHRDGGQQYYVTGITDHGAPAISDQDRRPHGQPCPTGTVTPPKPADVQPSFTQDVVNGDVRPWS